MAKMIPKSERALPVLSAEMRMAVTSAKYEMTTTDSSSVRMPQKTTVQ